jgi:predicted TIM-barrel fold metal-dependent hydrolase
MLRALRSLIYWLPMIMLMGCSDEPISHLDYLQSIKKIDIHFHTRGDADYLRSLLDDLNMKVCTMCTRGVDPVYTNKQIDSAREITKQYPRYYAWATTFDLSTRDEPHYAERVIEKLGRDFNDGALGVKVWKEIGMEIKNPQGEYIQLDDPMFTPIFEFIAEQGKTVFSHIGEPIQAWMPNHIGPDGKETGYWAKHPEFSFWDKPGVPSYEEIMAARDHVIARHPNLRMVGCHLGSLEIDVDEIAKRLDRYPNFAVEIGGRTRYFMAQARDKVRKFFLKYQDRIMYGTDRNGGNMGRDSKSATQEQIDDATRSMMERHDQFFRYFATDEEMEWDYYTVRGLALPTDVLKKVFYDNAVKWAPGVEQAY